MALEHRMVDTNGVRLHCAVDGSGPLVLLLHGFPECWYSWRHQIQALAADFRVVAPDLRGYNDSARPSGVAAYRREVLVADVLGLVHAFGERSAVVVGHDWGGAIAWTFATEHPEATRRLAVLNCPHPAAMMAHLAGSPRQLLRSWYMLFFQIPWLPETLLGLNRAWAVGHAIRQSAVQRQRITDEDVERLRDAASRPGALEAAINYYRAMLRGPETRAMLPGWLHRFLHGAEPQLEPTRAPADWPHVTAPTLLVWGERDVALGRELAEASAGWVDGPFALRFVPEAGHWVQQESPDTVNAALRDFLSDLLPNHPAAAPGGVEATGPSAPVVAGRTALPGLHAETGST